MVPSQTSASRRTRTPSKATGIAPSPFPSASAPSPADSGGLSDVIAFFFVWKFALLIIAAASPGPGYDTSTQLLLLSHTDGLPPPASSSLSLFIHHLVSKLTRWDAIYFATSSANGQVFEQEWAFSGTFATWTSALTRAFPSTLCTSAITCHALAGIFISHIAHLFAVLFLYRLTYEIIPSSSSSSSTTTIERKRKIAFTAACLHVLSPAGLFLSAPYGESLFAASHFAGLLCYVLARKYEITTVARPSNAFKPFILALLSGILIGFSSMIRSNGLLSGSIFAWDVLSLLPIILRERNSTHLIRLTGTVLAGICIGIGYLLPQIQGYQEFCMAGRTRPWCEATLPSIYTFVQAHYWNVGFLRYWSLSNLPLFLLATPMLVILALTALDALHQNARDGGKATEEQRFFKMIMARLVLPQLILTGLATTSFHVQIVNRIGSGYPGWYLGVAVALVGIGMGEGGEGRGKFGGMWKGKRLEGIVRGMVVYAVVQGGLFASFMPPA